MRFDSLNAWLAWQAQLNPAEIELGLERVRVVLHRLQLASPDFAVITVAGTNGKGSSVPAWGLPALCAVVAMQPRTSKPRKN